MVKSLLRITYLETYTILGLLENQGILENCYEIYCSNCEKFIDYKIIDSIDDIELNGKKAYGFNPRVIMDMHTSSLGFFYVTVDGNLYEMDILNPNNLIKIK